MSARCKECAAPAVIHLQAESLCEACAAAIIRKWKDRPTCGGECTYCGASDTPESVPASWDNEAWRELATYHQIGCEWVATRAHRIDEG